MSRSELKYWFLTITAGVALMYWGLNACSDMEVIPEKQVSETGVFDFQDQKPAYPIPDSILQIAPEDYPVIDEMLQSYKPHHVKLAGDFLSSNQVWFQSDSLNQTLAFNLEQYYRRKYICHFYTNQLPQLMLKRMEFVLENGQPASEDQRQSYVHSYMKRSAHVADRFFKSKSDFQLGDIKGKAIRHHGKPDLIRVEGNTEEYTWNYTGSLAYTPQSNLKSKPLIKNCVAQDIRMYFQGDSLIGVMIENKFPEKPAVQHAPN